MIEKEFWSTPTARLALNPRTPESEKVRIAKAVDLWQRPDVIWLRSSGTESARRAIKLICLEKKAILAAAESVNRFYDLQSGDVWLNPLPRFHIGGLAIGARCFLKEAQEFVLSEWQPTEFMKTLFDKRGSLVSLVPAQIFDLVRGGHRAPSHLRSAVVGGGALASSLFVEAKKLGWPLSLTYGMTETSAMVAATQPGSIKPMTLLDVVQIRSVENLHSLHSPGLFKGYLWVFEDGHAEWQERPEPFVVDDRLEVTGRHLKVLGRQSELVKILGETVNLNDLSDRLASKIKSNFAIVAHPSERRSFDLHLFVEAERDHCVLEELNQALMPFERLHQIHYLQNLPRTELGKIKKSELSFRLERCRPPE